MCVPREVVWIRIDRQVLLRRSSVGTYPIFTRYRVSFYTSVVPQLQLWHAPTVWLMLTRVSQFEFPYIRIIAGTESYMRACCSFCYAFIPWRFDGNWALLCTVCCLHQTTRFIILRDNSTERRVTQFEIGVYLENWTGEDIMFYKIFDLIFGSKESRRPELVSQICFRLV